MVVEVSYNFSIAFSKEAYDHMFALRIIPKTDERQKLLYAITKSPKYLGRYRRIRKFGDFLGRIAKPHKDFFVSLKSAVEINEKVKLVDTA